MLALFVVNLYSLINEAFRVKLLAFRSISFLYLFVSDETNLTPSLPYPKLAATHAEPLYTIIWTCAVYRQAVSGPGSNV